jgi:hypothetical protein
MDACMHEMVTVHRATHVKVKSKSVGIRHDFTEAHARIVRSHGANSPNDQQLDMICIRDLSLKQKAIETRKLGGSFQPGDATEKDPIL